VNTNHYTGPPNYRRTLFIDSYFKAVLRAVANGYDVRGFYYWSLMDNFEWATGYTMKFGLYAWEPDGSVDRWGVQWW